MKFNKPLMVSALLGGLLFSQQTFADVSGMVYQDLPVNGTTLNTYGVKDTNELGIEGITVTVIDNTGAAVGVPVVTGANGAWAMTGTSGNVRVEFSNIPSYLESSPVNNDSNTTVQFIADTETANLGLHNPNEFSGVSPNVLIPTYISGSGNGQTGTNLGMIDYLSSGQNPDAGGAVSQAGSIPTQVASHDEIGAVWGAARHAEKQRLYYSSFVKRHVGLANSIGSVYVVDYATVTPSIVSNFDLQGVTAQNTGNAIDLGSVCRGDVACVAAGTGVASDYTLPDSKSSPSVDLDAFAKVATAGFGDADMEPNTDNLWLVNLNEKALIKVDVSGDSATLPGQVEQYPITSPLCVDGQARPWGLGFNKGKGYVGVICDASGHENNVAYAFYSDPADNSSGGVEANYQREPELIAHVLEFDPNNIAAGFSTALTSRDLSYSRYTFLHRPYEHFHHWVSEFTLPEFEADRTHYWMWTTWPQPVLSDIVFDESDRMYLNIMDRYGHQMGAVNYFPLAGNTDTTSSGNIAAFGDHLVACLVAGNYVLQGDVGCGANYGSGTLPDDNPEFFYDRVGDGTAEGMLGAWAYIKGSGLMFSTMKDPMPVNNTDFNTFKNSGGLERFQMSDGDISSYYATYRRSGNDGTFSKANGVGDIEFLTEPAPLEIGNRVWDDVNGNGSQDAGEVGLDGVDVVLNCGAGDFTQTTVNGGQYLFTDDNVTGGIPREASCTITAPMVVAGNDLTLSNPTINEPLGSNPNIGTGTFTFTTGRSGQNNHTYDIGYRAAPINGSITIIKDATPDDPQDFAFIATGAGTSNFSLDDDTDATLSNTQTFTGLADGAYSFTETAVANWLLNGISCAGNTNSTITTNATGVDITLSGNESIVCTFYNNTHSCPAGQLQNIATITANETETTYANNSDAACLEVTSPTCSIVATAVVSACVNGSNDTDSSNDNYTIALTVTGSNASANFDYSSTPTGVSGTAIPFASSPYTTPAIIIESTDSPLTLTVTDSVDNNCSTTVTPVITEPATCSNTPEVDLRVVKTADNSSVVSGDSLAYTITVTNDGPSDATGVQITDNLPTGVTYQSHVAEAGTTFTSGTGIWDIGGVTVGQSVTLDITVTVD